MSNILRVALNSIAGDLDSTNQEGSLENPLQNLPSSKKSNLRFKNHPL